MKKNTFGPSIGSIRTIAPSFLPSPGSSVAKRTLLTRSQTGCIPPLRVPHVLWLQVVRASDRSGSKKFWVVFPPDPQRRGPESGGEPEKRKKKKKVNA